MTAALGFIYGLAMLLFTVAFIIEWIKFRKETRRYLKYGLWFGGLDLFIVIITPSTWNSSLITEPITLIRLIGFTMLGMYYAADLGYPSFPILLRKFKPASSETGNTSQDETPKHSTTDLLIEIKWREYFIKAFGVSILGILYSSILFLLTTPQMSEIVKQKFDISSMNLENSITFQGVLALLEIAIAEEIVFRLGIQNFLVKHLKLQNNNYWIAILLTSVLWTLGHAGVLEPEWVKLAQIFPAGVMLGWLYKRFGTESTILAHGTFNLVLAFLPGYLIK